MGGERMLAHVDLASMAWAETASDFEWDGSWRDVYVLNTTIDDWQRVLDALMAFIPAPVLTFDGEAIAFPLSAAAIFQRRENCSPLLSLAVGNVRLNCNFFQDDEIEFDLDPREVNSADDLESIKTFMRVLASRTGKTAILTHENTKSALILAVPPPV
jgi:hypothetical protein